MLLIVGRMSVEFWSVDTETDNNDEGGQAVLITVAGPGDKTDYKLLPKTFADVWEFLKGKTYTSVNMDFEAQALCHDTFLPYQELKKLARFKWMKWKGWTIQYIPSKFLTVSKGKEKFTVYDIQQFYGMSLKEAAQKHLGFERKQEIPRSWYRQFKEIFQHKRGVKFKRSLSYALQDARLAYLLTCKLVDSFKAVGVSATKLISPASLTMAYFGPQMREEPELDDDTNEEWEQGFYGGRVEVGSLGTVENLSLYDLHSAYPAQIRGLTSLIGCEVQGGKRAGKIDEISYGLYHATAYVPLDWKWGPLAVRDGAKVIYPVGAVKTWFCLPARKMLDRLGVKYVIHEAQEFRRPSGKEPAKIFTGIERLYLSRKDPVLSLAAKLMLNSLYGKLCESRRDRLPTGNDSYRSFRTFGRYTNYVLAAHVTESVRCQVFEVLHKFQGRAHYAATDSVMIEGELTENVGPDLGQWDLKGHYKRVTILGCGRYFMEKDNGESEGYLRGFAGTSRHVEKIKACRRRYVSLPLLQNLSFIQWANRGAADDLNVLKDIKKDLRCDDDKRAWDDKFKMLSDAFKSKIGSQPWIVGTPQALQSLLEG